LPAFLEVVRQIILGLVDRAGIRLSV
jgi:hypothetical protein